MESTTSQPQSDNVIEMLIVTTPSGLVEWCGATEPLSPRHLTAVQLARIDPFTITDTINALHDVNNKPSSSLLTCQQSLLSQVHVLVIDVTTTYTNIECQEPIRYFLHCGLYFFLSSPY